MVYDWVLPITVEIATCLLKVSATTLVAVRSRLSLCSRTCRGAITLAAARFGFTHGAITLAAARFGFTHGAITLAALRSRSSQHNHSCQGVIVLATAQSRFTSSATVLNFLHEESHFIIALLLHYYTF